MDVKLKKKFDDGNDNIMVIDGVVNVVVVVVVAAIKCDKGFFFCFSATNFNMMNTTIIKSFKNSQSMIIFVYIPPSHTHTHYVYDHQVFFLVWWKIKTTTLSILNLRAYIYTSRTFELNLILSMVMAVCGVVFFPRYKQSINSFFFSIDLIE